MANFFIPDSQAPIFRSFYSSISLLILLIVHTLEWYVMLNETNDRRSYTELILVYLKLAANHIYSKITVQTHNALYSVIHSVKKHNWARYDKDRLFSC